ncbi:MAG: type VI secretion system tip protein VgrG [Myxococcales bacterium]|nr:type VI secretion system tip protein VgrG [Myxococcales bacterium]
MVPTYHLVAHGLSTEPVRVHSFRAREAMSECYTLSIDGSADVSRDVARELLGRRATLVLNVGERPEAIHGVVHGVALTGHSRTGGGARASYAIDVGPRFWLLKRRRRSRVFQRMRVDEIVKAVLESAQVPMLWALQRELPVREYCTQYEESDEEFVRRILAEAGIFFYFLQPALPPEVANIAAILDTVLAALRAIPAVGDFLGSLGVGSITGEVMLFADEPLAYYGIGDLPEGLEGLIQSAIGRATSEIAAATGAVGAAVTSAVGDLAALGLAEGKTSRALRYAPPGDALVTSGRDVVQSFTIRHSVASGGAVFTTFDPRRPLAPLTVSAAGDSVVGRAAGLLRGALPAEASGVVGTVTEVASAGLEIARAAGADTGDVGRALDATGDVLGAVGMAFGRSDELTVSESHDSFLFPDHAWAEGEPRRILAAERRDRRLGRGESLCPMLGCGRRFTLVDHPVDWVNREYVVTEVVHEGRSFDGHVGEPGATAGYKNEFGCVPSDVAYPPPRPKRRTVQACLTATVIAPAHQAEMETHGMGEVKVRFHWEEGALGTCWIRTMQAWSGVGWGTQFMPRRGMEVVVGFDGGDPDRPLVLGCVYNATHPAPYALPEHETLCGIRTQSTPNGQGFNELSFEDRDGAERVYLHAERDLDVDVEHDRRASVLHDDGLAVENDQHVRIGGLQETRVDGGQDIVVRRHRRVEVEGTDQHVTRGEHQLTVIGARSTEIQGDERASCTGSATTAVGGDAVRETRGSSVELVRGARVVRAEGASEISSAATQEIASDSEIVLRCGASTIRVAPDCIELSSPEIKLAAESSVASLSSSGISHYTDATWSAVGSSALLASGSGSVAVDSEVTVQASQIRLRSGSGESDSIESEQTELTIVELRDQDGRPVGRERFRLELADGTVRTGHLDADGRAELRLDGAAEIVFPDLPEVTKS